MYRLFSPAYNACCCFLDVMSAQTVRGRKRPSRASRGCRQHDTVVSIRAVPVPVPAGGGCKVCCQQHSILSLFSKDVVLKCGSVPGHPKFPLPHSCASQIPSTMKFDFVAKQHSGNMPGSAMQCHNVYRLANILVSVMSSGRSHVGSITFKFRDQHGQQCTAASWLAEHPEPWLAMMTLSQPLECPMDFHGAPDVHISTCSGPGIDIEMTTHGRYRLFTCWP